MRPFRVLAATCFWWLLLLFLHQQVGAKPKATSVLGTVDIPGKSVAVPNSAVIIPNIGQYLAIIHILLMKLVIATQLFRLFGLDYVGKGIKSMIIGGGHHEMGHNVNEAQGGHGEEHEEGHQKEHEEGHEEGNGEDHQQGAAEEHHTEDVNEEEEEDNGDHVHGNDLHEEDHNHDKTSEPEEGERPLESQPAPSIAVNGLPPPLRPSLRPSLGPPPVPAPADDVNVDRFEQKLPVDYVSNPMTRKEYEVQPQPATRPLSFQSQKLGEQRPAFLPTAGQQFLHLPVDLAAKVEYVFRSMDRADDKGCLLKMVCEMALEQEGYRYGLFGEKVNNIFRFLGHLRFTAAVGRYQDAFFLGISKRSPDICLRTFDKCTEDMAKFANSWVHFKFN